MPPPRFSFLLAGCSRVRGAVQARSFNLHRHNGMRLYIPSRQVCTFRPIFATGRCAPVNIFILVSRPCAATCRASTFMLLQIMYLTSLLWSPDRYVFGCKVACYTHYPTISTDMLGLVERREQSYNNNPIISRSPLLSRVKLLYYRLFAVAYGAVGRCAHSAMSNSSWTAAHVSTHSLDSSDC